MSQSHLYQAIGSLLNTVATKFINDIEDLSDISADESTKLAELCAEVIKLEVLFTPSAQAAEAVPVTAVSLGLFQALRLRSASNLSCSLSCYLRIRMRLIIIPLFSRYIATTGSSSNI